ncbi:hypothetical protein LCM00_11025 [Bacillus infantis]|uniref:hypothetical protein n=1 Tax=Bacillus infantis TaxID=324767 RepID=UPI001CD4A968|nr:hypothetical protein [Bacillus infantis]MCA1040033.1 hypothetical protein [Bacillus infantis]
MKGVNLIKKLAKYYLLVNLFSIPVYFFSLTMAAFSSDSGKESVLTDILMFAPFLIINLIAMLFSLRKKDIDLPLVWRILFLPIVLFVVPAISVAVIFVAATVFF